MPDEKARAKESESFQSTSRSSCPGRYPGEAEKIISACKKAGSFDRGNFRFRLAGQANLAILFDTCCEFKKRTPLQPVRIVNQEAVSYGGQVAIIPTYSPSSFFEILHEKSNENLRRTS